MKGFPSDKGVICISPDLIAGLIHKSSVLLIFFSNLLTLSAFSYIYSYSVYEEKAETLARDIPNKKGTG